MKNIQRKAAKEFAVYWKDKGYEKGESQKFWLSLLRDVFGMEKPEQHIEFEEKVKLEHTNFIDAYIPEAKILIEQKGRDVNLWKANKQSDGSVLTPYQQAKRYIIELPVSKHPRWVITCNFKEFHIYNMEKPGGDPIVVKLENLEKEYYLLQILAYKENIVLKKEMDLSIAAGDIVGLLYNALAKQYKNPENAHSMKSLNVLCVRFVFCLYAEDAGVFKRHGQFHDYLMNFSARETRKAVIELFKILDQKPEDRDPYLKDDNPILAEFPYVNGGLFENEDIEIPPFTDEIRNLLLINASENFDWSKISPTIFGAVFESTLNPDTRRKGGMHYTSIENIHKVIDPLFLDELKAELDSILSLATDRLKKQKLQTFQKKLSSLVFLDPAAGSGNFLTESYICLRKLENQILKELQGNQVSLGFSTNQVQTIPEASLYHFGVLNSNVHMCWMRAVCGRLKSDFRYSKDIVYNNFPWPTPTPEQKRKIEETAQGILNARATYPDSCLSDLYDDNIMPADLRIAHNYNNIAVLEAYGFTKSSPAFRSESACVAELMKMYQKIVSK